MQKSREITLVIVFAVLSLITWATLGQLPVMITGIRGIGYAFLIVHAIPQAAALIFFEGRRWRFFAVQVIFAFLSLPTMLGGAPFDVIGRLPLIAVGFVVDVVVNSFYNAAQKRGKLSLWLTSGTAFRWAIDPFIFILIWTLYIPLDIIASYLSVLVLLLPIIMVEGALTGYIAYKIYIRIEKVHPEVKIGGY